MAVTHEELLARIKGLEEIMQAQGMMFTTHMMTCSTFQQLVIQELKLENKE